MKVCTADQKRRVVLPGVAAGDVVGVREVGDDRWELVRLVAAGQPSPRSRAEVLDQMKLFPLSPTLSWEELSSQTREL